MFLPTPVHTVISASTVFRLTASRLPISAARNKTVIRMLSSRYGYKVSLPRKNALMSKCLGGVFPFFSLRCASHARSPHLAASSVSYSRTPNYSLTGENETQKTTRWMSGAPRHSRWRSRRAGGLRNRLWGLSAPSPLALKATSCSSQDNGLQ